MQVILSVILCISHLLDTAWTDPSTSDIKSDSDDSGLTGLPLAPPVEVQSGETVRLPCNYELNGAVLHSVKWYKNDQELIRYVPTEMPPFKIFPLPGLHFDLGQTDERMVTLLKVDHHSTGTYKCEVTMDSPLFHTYNHSTQLRVVGDDSGLTGLRLAPPVEVQSGETVRLPCNYELKGDVLYSVKWYKNDQELIRYVPTEMPPFKIFPLPGLHFDLAQTNEWMVTLLKVDHHSTGTYKCEVSVNSPLFHTYNHSTQLRVVDVPVGEPDISAEKLRDVNGEQIQVISTAPPSNPAANLTGPPNDCQGCKPRESLWTKMIATAADV